LIADSINLKGDQRLLILINLKCDQRLLIPSI